MELIETQLTCSKESDSYQFILTRIPALDNIPTGTESHPGKYDSHLVTYVLEQLDNLLNHRYAPLFKSL